MSRDRIKYAACQSVGYADGSRDHAVAQVALDAALDAWPNSLAVVMEADSYSGSGRSYQRQLRKMREREERDLFRKTKAKTIAIISADPSSYGFGPIAVWFLGILISGIVKAIVQWLIEKRYLSTDGDQEIQSAISARAG